MAKVDGFRLAEAIRRKEQTRKVLNAQFNDSLFSFDDEKKRLPTEVGNDLMNCETSLVLLQCAQQKYNDLVTIKVGSKEVSLAFAIKFLGVLKRVEALWSGATQNKGHSYYNGLVGLTRRKDDEQATLRVSFEESISKSQQVSKEIAQYKAAIGRANAQEIEIPELTEQDFS